MTSKELKALRYMLQKRIEENKEINELLEDEKVKRLLILLPSETNNICKKEINEEDLLKQITKYFVITKSNKIYVLTGAYKEKCIVCYEETEFMTDTVPFDDNDIDYIVYKDIETGEEKVFNINKRTLYKYPRYKFVSDDFEKEHTILNPYNLSNGDNGYEEIRNEFFLDSIKYGQTKAKQKLLKKYNK